MKLKGYSAIITLLLVAFLATGAWAQSLISGDVVGTVTDSVGAVVPNATVTLKSEATGQVRNVTTNASGNYRFPLLQPGQYQVSATAQGFATQKKVVTVAVGQTPELNFALSVKGSTEVVEVTGEAPLLQTENGNSGTTFNQQQVSLLPNGGGDMTKIADFAPGVVMSTGGGYGNFTANGLPANTNIFTINGTNNMDPFFNTNNTGATNLSLGNSEIAETTVLTNAYSAQYGQQVGAQVTSVTKSGSNKFHGEANYLWTGRALSARDSFNAKPDAQPFENNNQYSANIGGPIVKDKTFFFASTEGLRMILPQSTPVYAPSPEFVNALIGDGTSGNRGYIGDHVNSEYGIYKQLLGYYQSAPGYSTASNASNLTTYAMQDSNVSYGDPASFLQPYGITPMTCTNPKDASTCTGTNYFRKWNGGSNAPSSEWLMTVRIDQNITQNDHVFFRFNSDHGLQSTYLDPINPALFSNTSKQPAYTGQAQWTHIFKSGATNQFIGSSNWYHAGFDQNTAGAAAFPYDIYTWLDSPLSPIGGENFNFPQGRDVHQHQLIDDYATHKGNHSLKFGFNYRLFSIDDYNFATRTNIPWMQESLYDFASGAVSVTSQRFPSQKSQIFGMWGLGLYAEDEYKASSKLSLTFGVRVEHNSNPSCQDDCFAQFGSNWSGVIHDASIPYNQVINSGISNVFKSTDSVLFAPRFGFAYSPFDSKKTVIRGGYGIFFDASPTNSIDAVARNFPSLISLVAYSNLYNDGWPGGDPSNNLWVKGATGAGWTNTWTNLAASATALKSGFVTSQTYTQISNALAANGFKFTPPSFTQMPSHFSTPMYQKYSVEIQQAIGNNDSINLAYTGNHGRNIAMLNAYANAYIKPSSPVCDADGNNCHPGARPNGVAPYPTSAPDSRFGTITQYTTDGYSFYNGLTATWNHRFTAGLQAQVNYTWSHSTDTVSSAGGAGIIYSNDSVSNEMIPGNVDANYGNSDYDVRHLLTTTFVWQPRFDSWLHAPKVIGKDWNISGTILAKSGTPFTVLSNAVSATNGAGLYPIYNGTQFNCDSNAVSTPCLTKSDFSAPTGADATISTMRRNMFRAPGYFDFDLSISKAFQVFPGHENVKLLIGANAFNLLNHPNFATPCSNVSACGEDLGRIQSTVSAATSPYGSFMGSAASARILQLNAKFSF